MTAYLLPATIGVRLSRDLREVFRIKIGMNRRDDAPEVFAVGDTEDLAHALHALL
jgi:hypothetical protein